MKKILFIVFILSLFPAFFYFSYDFSPLENEFLSVDSKSGKIVFTKEKPKGYLRVNEISKSALWAIILSEDWAFFDHSGVDFNQLSIVLREGLEDGNFSRGASTISQQVVKNVFLSSERSYLRKVLEIVLTIRLESKLPKKRILESYINLVELGQNLYGVGNASLYYFKKHPKDLNPKEGAFLAMLLPSPVKYSSSFKNKKLTEFAKNQTDSILKKMKQAGIISEEDREYYSEMPLSFEVEVP